MTVDAVLDELRHRFQKTFDPTLWTPRKLWGKLDHIELSDIIRWCEQTDLARDPFFDHLALRLAHGYHMDELPFGFCDAVVNDLFRCIVLSHGVQFPNLFWDVFQAFDGGEFHRSSAKDDDPEAEFTRPMIAQIVATHPLGETSG